MLIHNEIVIKLCRAFHAAFNVFRNTEQGLIWIHVAATDKHLLQLKHVVDEIFVLLQKLMFILSLLQFEKLLSETLDDC